MSDDPYTAPEFTSIALVTIDTQREYLDGQSLEVPGTTAILPAIARMLRAFRRANAPIVHIIRLYGRDGADADLCRRGLLETGAAILAPDGEGSQLPPELLADPGVRLDPALLLAGEIQRISDTEVVIYKPRWGAFFRTPLEAHLRSVGASTVVFCGANFPNCPRTSVYEASERDFRIVLARDAVSGLYSRGERELAAIGVRLMRSDAISQALASA